MKNRVSLIILSVASIALFAACNAKKDDKTYTYEYEYNGCNTGRQEYGSVEDMCAGLKDDARNK
ncbi:MAG: hypothetical protein V4760_11430, partial [Bdellovibrionota bacterium]